MYQNNAANPAVDAITFQVYEEEAYLFNQIVGSAIQDAAWNLTNAAFSLVGNLAAQNWVTAAENPANYQHVNLTGIFILSDVTGTNGQQEFIFDPPTLSSVPEPASLGLLGGVLGLACLWRRFSRRQIR